MISPELLKHIEPATGKVEKTEPVSGGSINKAFCITSAKGKFFIKINSASRFPEMFLNEVFGLVMIAKTKTIATPRVLSLGEEGDDAYLILEWIEPGNNTPKAQKKLGERIAMMHAPTKVDFGFPRDNYMGSVLQKNDRNSNGATFFTDNRLRPMVELANLKGYLTTADNNAIEQLYKKLPEIITDEPAALIHGDLWGGNYLISKGGKPYLIDPAISYGHREFDIAMTTLFGGFDRAFYEAYQSVYPLLPGWQHRIALYNLYPLLFHLVTFGGSYLGQVRKCIATYVK